MIIVGKSYAIDCQSPPCDLECQPVAEKASFPERLPEDEKATSFSPAEIDQADLIEPEPLHSFQNFTSQSDRHSFFRFIDNSSYVIKQAVEEERKSRPHKDSICKIIEQYRGSECSSILAGNPQEYSLRLFQLLRGYCDNSSFNFTDLAEIQELANSLLRERVQNAARVLSAWQLADPVDDLEVIVNILTLNLSAAVTVEYEKGQNIDGHLESLRLLPNDILEMFIEANDGFSIIVGERIEQIPFLWAERQGAIKMTIDVGDLELPAYWFSDPAVNSLPTCRSAEAESGEVAKSTPLSCIKTSELRGDNDLGWVIQDCSRSPHSDYSAPVMETEYVIPVLNPSACLR
jgi:hypothetical protein